MQIYYGSARIHSLPRSNSIAATMTKKESKSDESGYSSDEMFEFFKDNDLSIEKLPMFFVVLFNEMAKEENVTLDQLITIMKIGIQIEKKEKNKSNKVDKEKNDSDDDDEGSSDDMVQFTFTCT